MEAWSPMIHTLAKISKRHPQSDYAGLGVSIQIKWQYLQITVPGIGTMVVSIEEYPRETLSPALCGKKEVGENFHKILGHSVNCDDLGILDPHMELEHAYSTSKVRFGDMVGYLLGGTKLNYVCHSICAHNDSVESNKEREQKDLSDLGRHKEGVGGQESNHLNRETSNRDWLNTVPHCLN